MCLPRPQDSAHKPPKMPLMIFFRKKNIIDFKKSAVSVNKYNALSGKWSLVWVLANKKWFYSTLYNFVSIDKYCFVWISFKYFPYLFTFKQVYFKIGNLSLPIERYTKQILCSKLMFAKLQRTQVCSWNSVLTHCWVI